MRIIPFSTRNSMPLMKSLSVIKLFAHHPALFLIQFGTSFDSEGSTVSVGEIIMIPSLIRNCIPCKNAVSSICPSDHHPALFFTHSGTNCADTLGKNKIPERNIRKNRI